MEKENDFVDNRLFGADFKINSRTIEKGNFAVLLLIKKCSENVNSTVDDDIKSFLELCFHPINDENSSRE